MIFDEEIKKHLILYIKDYPESISFRSHGDSSYFTISGNFGGERWNRDSFCFEFVYDRQGKIKEVNGMDITIDMSDFGNELKATLKTCFKLKKKRTNLKKET